jgi:integrase
MARPKTEKTRHPGVYRVKGAQNDWMLRLKTKQPNGKEVDRRVRYSGTLQEAVQERARRVEEAMTMQPEPEMAPVVPTVTEYVERFVRLRAGSWKPSHRAFLATALGSAVESMGRLPITEVKPEHVMKWTASLRGVDGGIASTHTMRNYLQRFREVMEIAVLEGHIRTNPAHRALVKAPKGRPPREGVALRPDECQRLLEAMSAYDAHLAALNAIPYMGHAAYVLLAMTTGLRSGELTSLKWKSHVDLEAGTLWVVDNHWKGHPGTRKTGRRDQVYLSEEVQVALAEHQKAARAGFNDVQRASGLVFPAVNGKLADGRARNALRWACERAGLPRMVPHDLRHTATTLWNQVATQRVAQLAIGHASERAHNGYHHPYEDDFRRAGAAVGALVTGREIGADQGARRAEKPLELEAKVATWGGHLPLPSDPAAEDQPENRSDNQQLDVVGAVGIEPTTACL